MGRRPAKTRASLLRRCGVRVSSGPWLACAQESPGGSGRLIVALGRTAGSAVTRSRIRRIARQVFEEGAGRPGGADLLLLARGNVSGEPRREVRRRLAELSARLSRALTQGRARGGAHA